MVSYLCHFNSHAHVERDFINFTAHITHKISTHTLTWSVTVRFFCLSLSFTISTHTLTWSVTRCCNNCVFAIKISTHTLTWSVTSKNLRSIIR